MAKAVILLLTLGTTFITLADGANLRGISMKAVRGQVAQVHASGAQKNSAAVKPLQPTGPETPIKFLVAAFQDGERCAHTLYRALQKAAHPERVTFNVVQAASEKDVLCEKEFEEKFVPLLCSNSASSNCAEEARQKVRAKVITLEEGEGPVHQRGLLSEFADLSGEGSMCLATDSHMDFSKGWDTDLLEDWSSAENEFAVLSAYPFALEAMNIAGDKDWVELCGYFMTDRGLPRGATARPIHETGSKKPPQLTMNWAAGQSFARCHAEKNVPADKNLVWMFDGEEVNRAVRYWTHGYDLYNPRVNVVLHNYTAASQKFWSYGKDDLMKKREESEVRLKKLLSGDSNDEFGKYGLGDQRSIEQYVTWAHTNLGGKWGSYLKSKDITPHFDNWHNNGPQPGSVANFCNRLQRVPVRDEGELIQSAQ